MRNILRAAAKGLTVFLWVTKGLLLLIAVGVLVLWGMLKMVRSRGMEMRRI